MTHVRRFLPLAGCALLGCVLLALFAPGGLLRRDEPPERARWSPYGLSVFIDDAQRYLRRQPDDAPAWAELGGAYLEQARRTGDVTYYGKAQGAFQRSLRLSPGEPDIDAVIGMGSLANARHDFAGGLRWGERARRAAPYRWPLYGVLTDAYLELGAYDKAERELRRMLDGRPGLASFTRAARLQHLRGRADHARAALERAREIAADPAEYAFCLWQVGELAWNEGDPHRALDAYTQALAADPGHAPSLAGAARAQQALGRTTEALRGYAAAVARAPSFVVEYGELLEHLGNRAEARREYTLFTAQTKLLAANGVSDDLAAGRYEADHGDPAAAVRLLRKEWERRRSVEVADALGWALHRVGRPAEAARYAALADRLGGHNALFAYHRGEIERALGHPASARAHWSRALSLNPYFSFDGPAKARAALAETA
ncbi:tetratricopeptide repeat protein [Nonomuraea sp. M3C6]|uniref:Tetratricopeptide repeat protein n=1 Tax=Nonomuraea marmarensis TaxID=3351344 RepID=A0ABW7AFW4_9ACTN